MTHETIRTTSQPMGTLVWDPLVRFGHWALVAAFAVAYFSAEEEAGGPDPLHVWGGYVVGGIVVLRVLWGLVGPRHARFSDFVCEPLEALVYLRDLLLGRAPSSLSAGLTATGGLLKSTPTEQELLAVLQRPYLAAVMIPSFRDGVVNMLAAAELLTITQRIAACRDPTDDKFLELASTVART